MRIREQVGPNRWNEVEQLILAPDQPMVGGEVCLARGDPIDAETFKCRLFGRCSTETKFPGVVGCDLCQCHTSRAGHLTPVAAAPMQNIQLLPSQQGFVRRPTCKHLGKLTGESKSCTACGQGGPPVALHHCNYADPDGGKPHPLCTIDRPVEGAMCCQACPDHAPKQVRTSTQEPPAPKKVPEEIMNGISEADSKPEPAPPPAPAVDSVPADVPHLPREITWAYGVTTVPIRILTTLQRTLASLTEAGFDRPRLFVDGSLTGLEYRGMGPGGSDLEVTCHDTPLRAYGNWLLALVELFVRNPRVGRYAIFQDDLTMVKNARAYLDRVTCPKTGYWTLHAGYRDEEKLVGVKPGFHHGTQLGWNGALALVFSAESLRELFKRPILFEKPLCPNRGHKNIDGCVAEALCESLSGPPGWKEWVHIPSLVQHTGEGTTIRAERQGEVDNCDYPPSKTFPGTDFDALHLFSMGATVHCGQP